MNTPTLLDLRRCWDCPTAKLTREALDTSQDNIRALGIIGMRLLDDAEKGKPGLAKHDLDLGVSCLASVQDMHEGRLEQDIVTAQGQIDSCQGRDLQSGKCSKEPEDQLLMLPRIVSNAGHPIVTNLLNRMVTE